MFGNIAGTAVQAQTLAVWTAACHTLTHDETNYELALFPRLQRVH